jgi:large subunit ribosomal protein L32|tara:strand:- start:110 stop:292 length:183 start_codon:yes stop_codon:yes gene_type:complete
MAVPKKRTSRSKKNSRKATWMQKGNVQAKKAYSLAKSVLSGKSTSFIYSNSVDQENDEDE